MKFLRSINKNTLDDKELITKYRYSYDSAYVGELFQRYTHLVFGVCMKYLKDKDESQDAVMDIFEKALTDLKKHDVENFKSWIYSVARNHCLMKIRKETSLRVHKDGFEHFAKEFMENGTPLHLESEEEFERLRVKLNAGIAQLKDEQKECVELFFIQEKSYQEIADSTGYSLMQVKSYLQNGKRNLKIYLERNEQK